MNQGRESTPTPQESIAPDTVDSPQRYRAVRNVTLIGAVLNIILAIVKITVGYLGQSQALIADGLHSLSDLASDVIVIFAAKHGSRAADENHPYGHGRIETMFTVVLGVFLIVVAGGILIDSVFRLLDPNLLLHPGYLALSVALMSILTKEGLYRYTQHVALAFKSKLLEANAWHHRSDAISSIVVLIGIAGTMLGITFLDALAAAGMALMIIRIGWQICSESVQELIDTGLSSDEIESITATIKNLSGVVHMHTLRSRRIANEALVDVHIQVAPKLSVSEGHYIAERVRITLLKNFRDITDVTVHIDPENDENPPYGELLPDRQTLLLQLKSNWADIPQAEHIEKVNLHYLDGQIHVELLVPLNQIEDLQSVRNIAQQLQNKTQNLQHVATTKVLFY